MIEDFIEVWSVGWRTRRGRWHIDAVDVESSVLEEYFSGDYFDDSIVESGRVDGGELKIVVDQESDAAATSGRAVAPQ